MDKSLIHIPKDMIRNIEKWNITEKERKGLLDNLNKFFQMKKDKYKDHRVIKGFEQM